VNHRSSAITGTSHRPIRPSRDAAQRGRAFGRAKLLVGVLAFILHGRGMAADGEASVDTPQNIEELDVTARRQSALDAEAISLSDTPDAEPSVGGKPTIVVGLAARDAPVYDGSKKNKVSPFPYLDIHGIFHDRVFISDIRGIGFNLYTDEAFKAGLAVNYGGGRTSSDSPRLLGLPDIKNSVTTAGYLTYSIKPFAFELRLERQLGSSSATEASIRASYAFAPTPRWHLSIGSQLTWQDSKWNEKFYGVTAAEAAAAQKLGNLLTPYEAKSGLGTFGITGTSVYALTEHWRLATRLGFRDLMGSQVKNSPLTERNFGVDFALGAIYKF
jgi:outer membrane protein